MFVKNFLKINIALIGLTALVFTLSTCEEAAPPPPFTVNLVCPNGTAAEGTGVRGTIGCNTCDPGYALIDAACVPATATAPTTTLVTLPPSYTEGDNATVTVVADLEDPQAMITAGWTATDDFADPADADAWRGRSLADSGAAYVGDRPLNTCLPDDTGYANCDGTSTTITSPDITITGRYLNFLLAGRPNNANIGVIIQDSEQTAADFATENIAFIQPLHNAPPWTVSDYDWRTVDLETEMAETDNKIRIIIQDQAPGWVNVDHFFFSDTPWGVREDDWTTPSFFGGNTGYLRLHTGGFDPATGQPTALFDGFDDAREFSTDNGWEYSDNLVSALDTTTNAPPAADFLGRNYGMGMQHVNAGRVGDYAINTCDILGAGCGEDTATITSPPFQVTGRYLNFLLIGGVNASAPVVTIDGSEAGAGLEFRLFTDTADVSVASEARLRMYPNHCTSDFNSSNGNDSKWHSIDVSAYVGDNLRFQINDTSGGVCDIVGLDHMYFSDIPVRDNVRAALDR